LHADSTALSAHRFALARRETDDRFKALRAEAAVSNERRPVMVATALKPCGVVLLVAMGAVAVRAGWAGDEHADYGKLLAALPQSKHTLADGIQQAAAKSPEVAISAKFELDDNGKLSLSVYTAEKGLDVDAEHNVLKELANSPAPEKWSPEVEVFKDVEHVSRSAQQLTLMALTKLTLLDIVKKAEKDQPGTVFSITPVLRDRKAQFAVMVAAGGKVSELGYDLMTGEPIKPYKG
jgi:hypothetical protein